GGNQLAECRQRLRCARALKLSGFALYGAAGMTAKVVLYSSRFGGPMYAHEDVVLAAVARSIAELKRCSFAGFYRAGQQYAGDVFFVPDDTLVADEAAELG